MKALIRRMRVDADLQSGANRQTLNILADKLESDLRTAVEGIAITAVLAVRELNLTLARVAAEYARLKIPAIYVWKK
jgi:hypothetical protein